MIICGLKLTHDGAIALIDDNRLVCSIEMEKRNNNARFTEINDTSTIIEVLAEHGYRPEQVDHFIVDGWGGYDTEALAIQPRLRVNETVNQLSINNHQENYLLDIGQYHERNLKNDVLELLSCQGLKIGNHAFPYSSSLHVTGHILSAYCTSPFAVNQSSAYILIWDGGMYPRLYFFDADRRQVENLGPIFLLIGNIYTIFSQHFGPFKVEGSFAKDELSVAGKVMAYIALGNAQPGLFPLFNEIYTKQYDQPMGFANRFATEFKKQVAGIGYSDEDILLSFHLYLEKLLVDKLAKKIARHGHKSGNICLAGGCALNIKWNSAIRNSGSFKQVYVPPFPNDSGSAIGAACAGMLSFSGNTRLDWEVYAGPAFLRNQPDGDWIEKECSISDLAQLVHESQEPVLLLQGKAELGPRALGNRSIIGAATRTVMKDILNLVKDREDYRPVSPICMEEKATVMFTPGTPDPYMVFDHMVKEEWLDRIPAICHLDGSARLQTINAEQNEVVYNLLRAYEKISGIPLLCNTSANFKGKGFFPDVASAARWGRVNYIWSDGRLFEKKIKEIFPGCSEAVLDESSHNR